MFAGLPSFLILLFIGLLVLSIIALVRLGAVSAELRDVRRLLNKLLERKDAEAPVPAPPPIRESAPEPAAVPRPVPPPFIPPVPPPFVPKPLEAEPVVPGPDEPPLQDRIRSAFPEAEPLLVEAPPVSRPPPPPRSTFSSRNPDLEKFIGENLINKIGIAVLVVGIGFLLRYAIGQGYISEAGRTLIGLLAGGLLVFFAHRSREKFRAFSSVLVAGGIAVFYFTIAIAFHQYQLFGQTAAFFIMVGITGLGVAFTLAYDRKELAVIALLGGFLTPFMASTGEGNYRALFTYLLILDVGMLVLANHKKWPVINVISFALSWLLFGVWALVSYGDLAPPPVWNALGFATGFYAVFAAMILWYGLRHLTPFDPLDYSLFLANTAFYFGLGLFFLDDAPVRVNGLFAAALGGVNLLLALRFFRDQQVPRSLVYLLIGLVLTFLSLAAPVQLEGSHITLFWAAECVLLLWFSQRSGLKLAEVASILVLAAMLLSLGQDLLAIHGGDTVHLSPLLNKGWITGMAASVALFLYARLLRDSDPDSGALFPMRHLRTGAEVALVVVLYATNHLELQAQCAKFLSPAAVLMALAAYSLAFLIVLNFVLGRRGSAAKVVVLALFGVRLFAQITSYYGASRAVLAERLHYYPDNWFPLLHLLALALSVVVVVRVATLARSLLIRPSFAWRAYLWIMCALLVILASQELDHALILWGRSEGLSIGDVLMRSRKWGYPILWGAGSFLLMLYGMRMRERDVRIFALALFGVTLAKLFLFDIRGVSEGGKVAAFISLGVLLLVVSFLYQRLKGLLIDGPGADKTDGDATT